MKIELELIDADEELPGDHIEVIAFTAMEESFAAYVDGDLWVQVGGGIYHGRIIAWVDFPFIPKAPLTFPELIDRLLRTE